MHCSSRFNTRKHPPADIVVYISEAKISSSIIIYFLLSCSSALNSIPNLNTLAQTKQTIHEQYISYPSEERDLGGQIPALPKSTACSSCVQLCSSRTPASPQRALQESPEAGGDPGTGPHPTDPTPSMVDLLLFRRRERSAPEPLQPPAGGWYSPNQ